MVHTSHGSKQKKYSILPILTLSGVTQNTNIQLKWIKRVVIHDNCSQTLSKNEQYLIFENRSRTQTLPGIRCFTA